MDTPFKLVQKYFLLYLSSFVCFRLQVTLSGEFLILTETNFPAPIENEEREVFYQTDGLSFFSCKTIYFLRSVRRGRQWDQVQSEDPLLRNMTSQKLAEDKPHGKLPPVNKGENTSEYTVLFTKSKI